eukprot:5310700-Prymnesium_polylepis.3
MEAVAVGTDREDEKSTAGRIAGRIAAGSTAGHIGAMGRGGDTRASEGIRLDGKPCEEALGRGTEKERGGVGGNAACRPWPTGPRPGRQFGQR